MKNQSLHQLDHMATAGFGVAFLLLLTSIS